MKHATKHHIGHYSKTRQGKAKKAAPTGQRIYGLDTTKQGRSRICKGQKEVCTGTNAAYGFLKTSFLPKLQQAAIIEDAIEQQNTENDFYRSLCRMATHYDGLSPTDTRTFGYPYNLAISIWETENYLKNNVKDWTSLRWVRDDAGETFLITEHRYDTGTNLYYIPVVPLYKMLQCRLQRPTGLLLLSVCSYLYHIAGIPYYRQEDSYLYWEYEMIKEWIEQDEDMDEDDRLHELATAELIGDRMEQKMFNHKNIVWLASRIQSFSTHTDYQRNCLQLAEQALALYTEYPDSNIFKHSQCSHNEDEQENEMIRMDKYISFVAATKGWLYESLSECINNEFNEYNEMEEPRIVKRFDGSSLVQDNLAFEDRLFKLIDDLCYLLNND